jgi:hypothetical protein
MVRRRRDEDGLLDRCAHTVTLYGATDAIAAALYLASLSPGFEGYDEESLGRPNEFGFRGLDANRLPMPLFSHEAIQPDLDIGYFEHFDALSIRTAVSTKHRHQRNFKARVLSVKIGLMAPDDITTVPNVVAAWSARRPEVLFVTNRTSNTASAIYENLNAYFGGGLVDSRSPKWSYDVARNVDAEVKGFSARVYGRVFNCEPGTQPSRNVVPPDAFPSTFMELNRTGPDGLLRVVRGGITAALLHARLPGISLLDACLMSNLSEDFIPQILTVVRKPDGNGSFLPLTTSQMWSVSKDRNDARPPMLDVERVNQLSSLCARHSDLAELIAGDFGRTANGCHIVAFMARAAQPNSVEANGVAEVLAYRTDRFDSLEATDRRTTGVLRASGNPAAWWFLDQRGPFERAQIAIAALHSERDTQTYLGTFGPEIFTKGWLSEVPNIPERQREMIDAALLASQTLSTIRRPDECATPGPARPARMRI